MFLFFPNNLRQWRMRKFWPLHQKVWRGHRHWTFQKLLLLVLVYGWLEIWIFTVLLSTIKSDFLWVLEMLQAANCPSSRLGFDSSGLFILPNPSFVRQYGNISAHELATTGSTVENSQVSIENVLFQYLLLFFEIVFCVSSWN